MLFWQVPRYFFHLYNDEVTLDEEGEELPDVAAARDRARREVQVMAAEAIKTHSHLVLHHRIVVADAKGQEVASFLFGDVITVRN
jgi:hypothetical protein